MAELITEHAADGCLEQEAPTPKPLSRSTSASSLAQHDDGSSPDAAASLPSRTDGSSPDAVASVSSSLPSLDYPVPAALENLCELRAGEFKVTVQLTKEVGADLPPGLENVGSCTKNSQTSPARPKKGLAGLPEMDYPVPFDIQRGSDGLPEIGNSQASNSDSLKITERNTFLTVPGAALGSECEGLKAREVRSCPVSGIGCHPSSSAVNSALSSFVSTGVGQHEHDVAPLEDLDAYVGHWRDPPQVPAAGETLARVADDGNDSSALPQFFQSPVLSTSPMVLPPPSSFPSSFTSPMLPGSIPPQMAFPEVMLYPSADGLREFAPPAWTPQLPRPSDASTALPQLPSLGSARHSFGDCKPCAFFHTKGCGGGEQCIFCHLCEPGEKKRRLKERKAAKKIW